MSWNYVDSRGVCSELVQDDLLREAEGYEDADSLIESAVNSQVDHELGFKELASYIYNFDLEGETIPDVGNLRNEDLYTVMREMVRADLIQYLQSIFPDLLAQRREDYTWDEVMHRWTAK